jgi:hypothetical protein
VLAESLRTVARLLVRPGAARPSDRLALGAETG